MSPLKLELSLRLITVISMVLTIVSPIFSIPTRALPRSNALRWNAYQDALRPATGGLNNRRRSTLAVIPMPERGNEKAASGNSAPYAAGPVWDFGIGSTQPSAALGTQHFLNYVTGPPAPSADVGD